MTLSVNRGAAAMPIPVPQPGIYAENGAGEAVQPASHVPDWTPAVPAAATAVAVPTLAYAGFAAAVKDALLDVHSPDLLGRNPLLLHGVCNLGRSAGPRELRALLSEAIRTLFDNPRDEKLRQALKLTYCKPGLKQEVVADRLALSFGTYRRYLGIARDRLARWLWESWQLAQTQPERVSAVQQTATVEEPGVETPTSPASGAREAPRLSIVILPFLNISGSEEDDPFVDGITESLTTDLSRCSGVFAIRATRLSPTRAS
jgi:hypothetical protein